ncbi:MAG: FAD-dependent oxidoreductase, partial [Dehalococcoidia bacterium]
MLDVVVIGAGQGGLSTSYWLTQRGLSHTVLERGYIGESWRSQRWDSFVLNTPNALSLLPGDAPGDADPGGFWTRDEL